MKDYFDFMVYLAFRAILMYENKRSLTIEQLHNYRKMLCEKHIEYHSRYTEYDDYDFEQNLRFFHATNNEMSLTQEMQNILKFINDNDEYFYYKDGVISLRDEITYKDLEDINFGFDSFTDRDDKIICGELNGFFDSVECLDILGVKKVKDFIYKIIEDEKKIENAYQKYFSSELEEKIKNLSVSINYRLALIGNLNEDKIRCYHRALGSLRNIDNAYKGDNVRLLSDNLMNRDKFYNLNSRSIDTVIRNKYQRAIFDNGTLVYDKLNNVFDEIWAYMEPDAEMEFEPVDLDAMALLMEERMEELDSFEDEYEDDSELDFDEEEYNDFIDQIDMYLYIKRINMIFYLNYINHIEKLLREFGRNENLESSKRRLLYLLDNYGDDLFKEENFKNALNNLSMDEINYKEDFDDFYILSRLFLVDILECWIDDSMILSKMLFIFTYYDLTNDRRIKRIIDKYRKTEIGLKVSEIILEKNYRKLMLDNMHSTKKLIKKKD